MFHHWFSFLLKYFTQFFWSWFIYLTFILFGFIWLKKCKKQISVFPFFSYLFSHLIFTPILEKIANSKDFGAEEILNQWRIPKKILSKSEKKVLKEIEKKQIAKADYCRWYRNAASEIFPFVLGLLLSFFSFLFPSRFLLFFFSVLSSFIFLILTSYFFFVFRLCFFSFLSVFLFFFLLFRHLFFYYNNSM